MSKHNEFIYEAPDVELMEVSAEGILCASVIDSAEYYQGDDKFEKLF